MTPATEGEDGVRHWALGLIPLPADAALAPGKAQAFLARDASAYARVIALAMTSVEAEADRAAYGMLALDLASRIEACTAALAGSAPVTLDRSYVDDVGEPEGLCIQLARICATRPAEADPSTHTVYEACARQIVTLLARKADTGERPQ